MDAYSADEVRVGPIKFDVKDGRVVYDSVEKWVNIDRSHTVRCELSSTISFKRIVGTTLTDIKRLTAVVESSLSTGIASLKSKLESETSREFTLTESTEEAHEFVIPAPHCGRQTYYLYQRVRDHRFIFKKQRWPKKLRAPLIIEAPPVREYTANFEVRIDGDRDDPACPCNGTSTSDLPGEILRVSFGSLSVVATADRHRDSSLSLMIGPDTHRFVARDSAHYQATIEANRLPDLLRGLSGIETGPILVTATIDEEGEAEPARIEEALATV